jgi:hypothetical protein
MNRITSLVLASFLVTGCVGAGPVTTKISTPEVSLLSSYKNLCPTNEVGRLSKCKDNEEPSVKEFIRLWGEPNSHKLNGEKETLTYNRDLAWRGLVVFAIVPIPLLLPVGHNDVRLDFDHDKLTQVASEYGYGSFAICGMHSEGPNGFGCVIWH